MDQKVRNLTVNVSKDSTLHCLCVNFVHVHAGEEVKTVKVVLVVGDLERSSGLVDLNDCLIHDACAVLDELTHGVEICCVINACREDTSSVLALRLTVELLPPLCHVVERRLVVDHDLCGVAGTEQAVTYCSVLIAGIL